MNTQAIETRYAGCYFRSRLEARWAVFFDTLGIEWQYEPEAFTLTGSGGSVNYLPDFYLPTTQTWVEVKGAVTEFDWYKLAAAVDFGNLPHTSDGYRDPQTDVARGLLLLGTVPRPLRGYTPTFPLIQHESGCQLSPAVFMPRPLALHTLRRHIPHILVEYDVRFDSYGYCDEREEWVREVMRVWPEREGWIAGGNETTVDKALAAARSARFGT